MKSQKSCRSFQEMKDAGLVKISSADLIEFSEIQVEPISSNQALEESVQLTVYRHLWRFHELCSKYDFPTNNPIAFYNEIHTKKGTLASHPESKRDICELLKLAYVDQGFLFGSAYEIEHVRLNTIRPADVYCIGKLQETDPFAVYAEGEEYSYNVMEHAIQEQSSLLSSRAYYEDKPFIDRHFRKLEDQAEKFRKWHEKASKRQKEQPGTWEPSRDQLKVFFNIYRHYCMKQLANGADGMAIRQVLNKIETAATAVLALRRICICIMKAYATEKLRHHLSSAIAYFRKYVKAHYTELSQAAHLFDNQDTGFWTPILDFYEVLNSNADPQNHYPHLLKGIAWAKLTSWEKDVLSSFQCNPIHKCFNGILMELQKDRAIEVAPYFLLDIFKHRMHPLNPFTKSEYRCKVDRFKINTTERGEGNNSIRLQESAVFFFNALVLFCHTIPQYNTKSDELCEFIFERCFGYVPHHSYIIAFPDIGESIQSTKRQQEILYEINRSLQNNLRFEPTSLPQYAHTRVLAGDFYHFFYHPQDANDKLVLKRLRTILTDKQIDTYADIVLNTPQGYGTSFQSEKWHISVAEFFDSIIEKDEVICDYVDGADTTNVYLPEYDMQYSELRSAIIPINEDSGTIDNYLPNLARVQLAIHAICLKRISETTRKIALALCREFLY